MTQRSMYCTIQRKSKTEKDEGYFFSAGFSVLLNPMVYFLDTIQFN